MSIDFIDKNNLLWIGNSAEEYFFDVWNINIKTNKNQLLTYYKNSFHEKSTKEIGDKMTIFFNFDRKEIILSNLNKDAFFYSTNIYQRYDEDKNQFKSYIYDFPKQEIEDMNEIIFTLSGQENYLKLEWSLVEVETLGDENKIFERVKSAIEMKDFEFIFSFLFGLVLSYGKFDIKEDALLAAKIHIPLVWNLINKKEKFDEIINFLTQNGIFAKTDILNKKFGYVYQISITDWEILQNFVYFLKPITWDLTNVKYQKMQYFRENIKNYVEKNQNIDNIYNHTHVLKYLEK